ncbi:acyl carrier protein [Streptomyces sp. NPDC053048]|uniref:acyl carrier protein n=1 Tax=Streptomyces sp. NPDC053048 TaxID=3365694 RepID=UPI0037D24EED
MPDPHETLLGILEAHFGIDRAEVNPSVPLTALELDSLARAELALILRDRLGVALTEEDLPEGATVRNVLDLLAARMEEAEALRAGGA